MANDGARVVFVPAAFNMTTGPAHWELLFRSRALDNQIFMLGASSARDSQSSYVAYGHSLTVNPWGQVMAQLDEKPGILLVDLDLAQLMKPEKLSPCGDSVGKIYIKEDPKRNHCFMY